MKDDADVEKKVAQMSIAESSAKNDDNDEDDEYADMPDFEDNDVMEDEAAAISAPSILNSTAATNNKNENILKVRSYDVSITYDKYYQTQRVWLMGYAFGYFPVLDLCALSIFCMLGRRIVMYMIVIVGMIQ